MKPNISFPDISHSEAEKRVIAKFKELHEKDDRALRNFNIVVIAVILIASIICGSFIAITISEYWIPVRRAFLNFVFWLDDLPVWVSTCIILFALCVISVSLAIINSARIARKNPEND